MRADGATALFVAAQQGEESHMRTMKIPLAARANPNIPNDSGDSPTVVTWDNGRLDAVKILISSGADPLHMLFGRNIDIAALARLVGLEAWVSAPPRCGWCFGAAHFACVRCQVTLYCGKDHQAVAWPTHRALYTNYIHHREKIAKTSQATARTKP
jgi:hypothetical protein